MPVGRSGNSDGTGTGGFPAWNDGFEAGNGAFVLPGLRQVKWDLAIVDEAHRMSWTPPARKTARYALGELLRDTDS